MISTTTKSNKKIKFEIPFLILILLIASFLRFSDLSYSDFYGDETKVMYTNKSLSATEFFFNQRKGPLQFFVSWAVEGATGEFNEGYMRAPFAIAGTLSVLVLYLFVRRRFGFKVALFATALFSLNGFYIAFSRTVQYQSFLILFGLASLLLADLAVTNFRNKEKLWYVMSGVSLGLAFLAHYDSIFFAIPIFYLLYTKYKQRKFNILHFTLPLILLLCSFYIPYLIGGHFNSVIGYLFRRVTGNELLISNSFRTMYLYNPNLVLLGFFGFSFFAFLDFNKKGSSNNKRIDDNLSLLVYWFVVPFVLFEFVFANPGTHIHNYLLPLLVLSAIGIEQVTSRGLSSSVVRKLVYLFVSLGLLYSLFISYRVFVPSAKSGYPWNLPSSRIKKDAYQLFLYGFPYKRGWDQIGAYLLEHRADTFYTNGNTTVGEYYASGVFTVPDNPKYYVEIFKSQEFKGADVSIVSPSSYKFVKDIYVDGEKTAEIYKRIL